MNKIMLIGNLGRDPEMSYMPSGRAITKFTVATSRRWKDRESGERKEETQWFNVVAFDQLAETCNSYLHKGSKAYFEGRMQSRKFTNKDNVEVTYWEVNLENMEFVEPKGASQGGARGDDVSGADDIPF
ncbi:MAG TPA: single-stranded DNA-binding protein [Ktedonobacterales bacterium]|nr:single-stranded DNA-binding protein [Ktedonobacterales bacterium]